MLYRLTFFAALVLSVVLVSGADAVTISPTKQSLTLNAGETKTVFVTVTNDSAENVTLTSSVDPFTVDSDTGTALFGQSDVAQRWISISPRNATVRANAQERIAFTISVPEDAPPESHYLGLFAETKPADGDVVAGTRIGSLLFLYVAGSFQESFVPQDFSPDRPVVFAAAPSVFLHAINEGNIHVIPQGEVVATDVFGRVVAGIRLNEEQIKVFPKKSFVRPILFDNLPKTVVGPLDVRVRIVYGLSEQTFFSHTRVWVFPPLFLGLLGAVLVSFVLIVAVRKHRGTQL